MFMSVTSRPLFNEHGVIIHDGKFEIFSFVSKQTTMKEEKKKRS